MPIKVAFIGAGSIGFTRGLTRDLLSVPEFNDIEIAYTDINAKNLARVGQLVARDIRANRCGAKLTTTTSRRKALEGAKYVFSVVRIGGLEAFHTDIDIPLKYGIDQCVGDTLCAGGIMYGQRNIPATLDFCKDLREVAASDCLFMNYANPMAMNTWACLKYGGVKTIGLCHGVEGGHWMITRVIERVINKGKKEGDKGFRALSENEVDIVCAGINHQTWYVKVLFEGEDWATNLVAGFENHPWIGKTEKVRIDMMKRFGYFSTESNGHLSEYVPWYRKRPREIKQWIDLAFGDWIHGETGGYLRVCTEGRNWFETDFPNWMKAPPEPFTPERRSKEHGSWIIEALETGRTYRGHFNVRNNGIITNLAADCVVEAPGYVDRNGINMPLVGNLPLGCAAVCNASINVQRLAVEAAVHGDDLLLRQAMMMDPLVGAVCNPPEIWQMTDEMLVAGERWLPQYKKAITAAKKRLASGKKIKTNENYKGAARLKTKTISEMKENRADATKNAAAADKAKTGK